MPISFKLVKIQDQKKGSVDLSKAKEIVQMAEVISTLQTVFPKKEMIDL